jgi:hypothetical protein
LPALVLRSAAVPSSLLRPPLRFNESEDEDEMALVTIAAVHFLAVHFLDARLTNLSTCIQRTIKHKSEEPLLLLS